jgi:hypothetical protein
MAVFEGDYARASRRTLEARLGAAPHDYVAGLRPAPIRLGRMAVLPHPRPFQCLARPPFDAAVARLRA